MTRLTNRRRIPRDRLPTIAIVLLTTLVLLLPPLLRTGGDLGQTASVLVGFGVTVLIYAVLCVGLNVQAGYAGITNFGVAAFFMLGAYVAAIFVTPPATNEFVTYVGGFGPSLSPPFLASAGWLPHLVGALAAAVACGLLAACLSLFTRRLRLDYLAILTIGIAELLRALATAEVWIVNGERGLIGITRPLADFVSPALYPFLFLVLAAGVLAAAYVLAERAVRSPWGRVLRALREDELGTAAAGKNVVIFKTQAFVMGAAIIGVGAALFAYNRTAFAPSDFEPLQGTFLVWVMLIVGGIGSNRGAILGAYVVWGLWVASLSLSSLPLADEFVSRIPFIRFGLLGVAFIVMLLFRPQGLYPEERRVSKWVERLSQGQRSSSSTENST